jgi:hypothetical protein
MIGPPGSARDFMPNLAGRLAGRAQLTSDGLKCTIRLSMRHGQDVDYAQPVKTYGEINSEGQRR